MPRIPVAWPNLLGIEEKYVVDAIRSTWNSSTGPYIQRFEKKSVGLRRTYLAVCVPIPYLVYISRKES